MDATEMSQSESGTFALHFHDSCGNLKNFHYNCICETAVSEMRVSERKGRCKESFSDAAGDPGRDPSRAGDEEGSSENVTKIPYV